MKNLKKISILFLSIITLVFTACDNEPLDGFDLDGDNPFVNSLVGTWTLVDFNSTVNSSTEIGGMTIESNVAIDGFNPNYDLIFTSNTFTTNGSYSYDTEITISGQPPISDSYSLDNVSGAGIYSVSGNEMTIDGSFFEFEFQGMDLSQLQGEQIAIFSISPDGQTLTFTQNTTETGGAGGATTTSTVTGSSVWSRVTTNNTTCADASDFATAAANAYNNDNTNVDLCNAYKSALQNQIGACGDASGELQAIITGLGDCIVDMPPLAVEISLTAGTQPIEFDLVEVVAVGTTLQVTGETSAQNNFMIYFEVEEGTTGMEIINSTFVLTLSTTDPDFFPSTQGFDDFTSSITENGVGTIVGTFGGVVTNSSGADLSVSQGVININY